MFRRLATGALATLLALPLAAEGTALAQVTPFSDSMVQATELRAPSRGSVTGQYANTAFGPGDVSRGTFSLLLPIAVPDERGGMQASPFPSYSPEAGASEWGVGWQSVSLVITRSRVLGDLDYATDDRSGPWGRMIKGSDGYWYPDGLREAVRVVDEGATLIAYTPDGSTWTFGGSDVVTTPKGTYAWYLASVVDVLGRTTSFTYTANASGRRFLADVTYGGTTALPAYDVHFTYQPTSVPLTDYRSGTALVLDQRVQQVTSSIYTAEGALATRWTHALTYTQDAPSPAFYLTTVQQTFASGEQPPTVTYTYGAASAYLATATVSRATKLDALVPTYGADVIQPNRSASFDADDDGRPDLEFSYDDRLLVQTDTGFTLETLPPTGVTTDPICRHAAYSGNAPRLVTRMRGNDASYSVIGMLAGVGSTSIAVCTRAGEPLYQTTATGAWTESALAKLADVNRDLQPDFVTISPGSYSVLPNTSTATAYSFGTPIHGTLSPVISADTLWVHDFNGDGVADLVARAGSSIVVWPGKGQFAYDTGRAFDVVGASGLPIPLTGYTVTFTDANGDGLADVLLQQGSTLALFLNNGSQLKQVSVPALSAVNWTSGRPVAFDLAGTGNPSVAFISASLGYSLDLSEPPVGLLSSANDGKGTVLSFTYAPAPPTPGQRLRHSLLTSLGVASTGYDTVSYGYTYAAPTLHSVGEFLVGYDQVSRRGPLETQIDTFLNGDDFAGLPSTSEDLDDLEPSVARLSATTYADVTSSFGIAWKRRLTELRGWESTAAQNPTSEVEQTEYTAFSNDVCATTKTVTSSTGTLTTQTTFGAPANFTHAIACLPTEITVTGTHSDATLNFQHQAVLARNAAGQVTVVTLYDTLGHALAAQSITYDPAGLVATVTNVGKGSTLLTYVTGTPMLATATAPGGVATSVTSRDPLTDAVLALTTTRGGASNYVQSFAYDGQERLASAWNNLGGASAALPDQTFTYRYASGTTPALVETATLLDATAKTHGEGAEITSTAEQVLANAHLIPQGWAFGGVTQRSRATRTTTSFTKPTSASDVATFDVTSLYSDGAFTSSTQSSVFGVPVARANLIQSGVREDIATALALPASLVRTDVENGQFTTTTTTDAAQRVTSIVDAAGAQTSYVYDALGRVRRVHLADGTIHSVDYDDDGRPAKVDRAGVAVIAYRYDATTGLLDERDFLGADGSAHAGVVMRKSLYVYDASGRVTTETDEDPLADTSQAFTFYYDGAAPSAPTVRTALGLLTAVTGNEYSKTLTYRADGSLLSSIVSVAGWRKIETDLTYAEDGFVSGRTVTVRDATGTPLLQDTDVAQRDAYGRTTATLRDGSAFSALTYDANGLPSTIMFETPYGHGEIATTTYDLITRGALATTLKGPAWSSSVGRQWSNRGLLASESFAVDTFSRRRTYGYAAQGFLAQSSDADATYSYAYDATGLPTNITSTIDGTIDARSFTRSGSEIMAGTHHHTFDDLGRVIVRDDVDITYGPNGQISHAQSSAGEWDYLYDENGQRIAKLQSGTPLAAYLADGSYLSATDRTVPVAFGGTLVGVLVEPTTAGSKKAFQLTVADERGSVLADANGTPHLASPFGDRAAHPDIAAAIDYATKGWDADLGVVRMGVRDYDPALSRFLQPDPLFLADPGKALKSPVEANLYGYAKDDPALYRDLSGTCAEDACLAEGAVTVFVGLVFASATLDAYVHQPAVQRDLSAAVAAGSDAAREAAAGAKRWAEQALTNVAGSAGAYLAARQVALSNRFGSAEYVFATYTVPLADGSIYSGRTSTIIRDGESAPDAARRAVNNRWESHHMEALVAPGQRPTLDAYVSGKVSTNAADFGSLATNYSAIRGREQQLIDANGRARSDRDENGNPGTSGNAIRGVAKDNPLGAYFDAASTVILTPEFGPAK